MECLLEVTLTLKTGLSKLINTMAGVKLNYLSISLSRRSMCNIRKFIFLFLFIGCSSNPPFSRVETKTFLELCSEVIERSFIDHAVINKEEAILLVSKNGDKLAFLVWYEQGLNQLLGQLDITLVGYVSNQNNEFLLVDEIEGLSTKPVKELPYYSDEAKSLYKEQLNWTEKSGVPPPPPPLNINPFIYYYKIGRGRFTELKKGNNLKFPI